MVETPGVRSRPERDSKSLGRDAGAKARDGRPRRSRPLRRGCAAAAAWLAAASAIAGPAGGAAAQAPAATLVALIHPEWDGVWKAAPGTVDDRYTPFEAASRKAGRKGSPIENPPLKPELMAAYRDRVARMRAGQPVDDPVQSQCQPMGMPRVMLTDHPFRLSILPDRIFWYAAYGIQPRQIYMDGRVHPSDDDIDLLYRGESIGRWEGDTLVIDTKGFTKKTFVDGSGVPHGERMHIVERVRMIKPGRLAWRISVDDPDTFTQPWETTLYYDRVKSGDIGDEYICSAGRATGHL